MAEQKNTPTIEKEDTEAINEKRRRAMVWYMLSVFLVAAILVTVSLLVQNRNLKLRDTEKDANSQNLQGRIEALQEEERDLRKTLAEHLLEDAVVANDEMNTARLETVMLQLENYADILTGDSKETYNQLKNAIQTETETEANNEVKENVRH